jgi:hypothetical protein
MKIYQFHPISGDFMWESVADESPLESGKYLVPAHSTVEAPPQYDPLTQVCKREGSPDAGYWKVYTIEESQEKSENLNHGLTQEQIDERDRRDAEIRKEFQEALEAKRQVLQKLGLSEEDIEKLLVV